MAIGFVTRLDDSGITLIPVEVPLSDISTAEDVRVINLLVREAIT